MSLRKILALVLVGAVGGTLGDQIHVQFGVLSYPTPASFLFGQARWVPLLFALATPAMIFGHALLYRVLDEPEAPTRPTVIAPALLFLAAYFATGIWYRSPLALAAGLALAWLVRLALRPSLEKMVAGLAFAAIGPLFEGLLSSTGAFRYVEASALRVPPWLPALYLHLSLLTRHVYLAFVSPHRRATRPLNARSMTR